MKNKLDIYVYFHGLEFEDPIFIGTLSAISAKGRKAFSFEYSDSWLKEDSKFLLDPDIQYYKGQQYPEGKGNFGIFLDSMPDTWGRTLMKRRAAQKALVNNERNPTLYEVDYLLGVFDESRMGALRFKTEKNGPFLDNNNLSPTPPWSSIRELQEAAYNIEKSDAKIDLEKWIRILIAPGSSLGGARPKANVVDENKDLWIAKFPSKNDHIDKAAWEFLAYQLAIIAGIQMSECRIEKILGKYHTFFTKRFDRKKGNRIHFASAMTMTGNSEDTVRDAPASYLDLVEFISNHGTDVEENLHQLWRRMVFNIFISNTDDHLRNHGFILTSKGWILSPAYDINPSVDKDGLSLNIDLDNNALDLNLARSVGVYFRLSKQQMCTIEEEIRYSISQWESIAKKIGISREEQLLMSNAFRLDW